MMVKEIVEMRQLKQKENNLSLLSHNEILELIKEIKSIEENFTEISLTCKGRGRSWQGRALFLQVAAERLRAR